MPSESRAGDFVHGQIVKAKTAAYTVTEADSGTLFTTRGATAAITFTLPAIASVARGTEFTFFSISAYGFVLTATAAVILLVDAAGTSLTVNTSSNIIGANVRLISDGVNWLAVAGEGPAVGDYALT